MINAIRDYLIKIEVIDEDCRINVDFLGENPSEFSIEKIPVNPILEPYIAGCSLNQFQFQLVSCEEYGADVLQNISNSIFYENLYNKIEENNNKKVLPEIEGIQTIECLDNGCIETTNINTARYSIQMRITYFHKGGEIL